MSLSRVSLLELLLLLQHRKWRMYRTWLDMYMFRDTYLKTCWLLFSNQSVLFYSGWVVASTNARQVSSNLRSSSYKNWWYGKPNWWFRKEYCWPHHPIWSWRPPKVKRKQLIVWIGLWKLKFFLKMHTSYPKFMFASIPFKYIKCTTPPKCFYDFIIDNVSSLPIFTFTIQIIHWVVLVSHHQLSWLRHCWIKFSKVR